MTIDDEAPEVFHFDVESIGAGTWKVMGIVSNNLTTDAARFETALQRYLEDPMDITRLHDIHNAIDLVLEQRNMIIPLLESFSRYLDQHLKSPE
ncbi:MAG TPA: hypothetical protein VFU72_03055 [Nitrolancea sp.]|nr:hypothetical protein [Nitrolancea sp.]